MKHSLEQTMELVAQDAALYMKLRATIPNEVAQEWGRMIAAAAHVFPIPEEPHGLDLLTNARAKKRFRARLKRRGKS